MPTVIDELIVTFGLDPTNFSEGEKVIIAGQRKLEEASERQTKNTEKNATRQSDALKEVTKSALELFTVFTAGKGIEQFVQDTVKTNAALGRTALNLNMSAAELSKWQNVFERGGGTAGGITGTLSTLTTEVEKFQATGKSELLPWFKRLGIDLQDPQTGRYKEATEVLLEMADRLSSMPRPKANYFGSQMGVDQDTLNVIDQGRSKIQELLDTQDKIGHVTDEDAKSATILAKDLKELGQASSEAGTRVLTDLTPALDGLLKALTRLAEFGQQHPKMLEGLLVVGSIGIGASIWGRLKALFGAGGGAAAGAGAGGAAAAGESFLGRLGWVGALLGLGTANMSDMSGDELKKEQEEFAKRPTTSIGDEWRNSRAGQWWDRNTKGLFGAPLGIRNNNPGNLRYVGQLGATYGESGFAHWQTMGEGIQALHNQILRYEGRGLNTIRKIISTYAPKNENNTAAYIKAISNDLGISPDAVLSGSAEQNQALERGIITMENGRGWSQKLLGSPVSSGDTSSAVNIGSINIQTQATDAKGIAGAIAPAVKSQLTAVQANTGLR